jgi:hypothetical protein
VPAVSVCFNIVLKYELLYVTVVTKLVKFLSHLLTLLEICNNFSSFLCQCFGELLRKHSIVNELQCVGHSACVCDLSKMHCAEHVYLDRSPSGTCSTSNCRRCLMTSLRLQNLCLSPVISTSGYIGQTTPTLGDYLRCSKRLTCSVGGPTHDRNGTTGCRCNAQ